MPPTWLQSAGRILLTSIRACNEGYLNPFKTNFSLTFSKKNEYIFLSYVSIEELFRK